MNQIAPIAASCATAPPSGAMLWAQPVTRLLLVDADHGLRGRIAAFLADHGFMVFEADDPATARAMAVELAPDLVVMDIALCGEDGLSALRELSVRRGLPVIVLSALAEEVDRIVGLEAGADDYLAKPVSMRELLARIRAVRRRLVRIATGVDSGSRYGFAGWRMDVAARTVLNPVGELVALSDGEFALLRAFVASPRRVLTRDQLLEQVRGPMAECFDRAIDTQVSRLRRKLEGMTGAGAGDRLIRTIRGEGYMFCAAVERRAQWHADGP